MPVSVTGRGQRRRPPETGLQSRWYHQHRTLHAPDRPEPNEPRVPPRSNVMEAQVHLVHRRADLHEQLKPSDIAPEPRVNDRRAHDMMPQRRRFASAPSGSPAAGSPSERSRLWLAGRIDRPVVGLRELDRQSVFWVSGVRWPRTREKTMTSKMADGDSAADGCAPRRVGSATPGPGNRVVGAVGLRARVQVPVAARDWGGYGRAGCAAAGPPPHGHTPA